MSMHRFRRIGPNSTDLAMNYLPAGVTLTVGPIVPEQTCDMFLSNDDALGDLQQAIANEWEYVGLVPEEG